MSHREEILACIGTVPALPTVGMKVIAMIQDPSIGVSELMRVIEYDPGLTSNVLRLANSAYFAGSTPIVSLRDAGVRLGMNRIFQLVMTLSVSRWATQPIRGYAMTSGQLLRHSIAVAITAEGVATALGKKPPAHAFTTGLLHDIGKVVLGTFVAVDVAQVAWLAVEEHVRFDEAERRVLDIDHAEVGAALLESWHLPKEIVAGVRCHHAPEQAEDETMAVELISFADSLCLANGMGLGVEGVNYAPSEEVIDRMKISPEECESVVGKTLAELEDLGNIFNFGSGK